MAIGDFIKTVFANGTTPAINATNLNNIGNKIAELDSELKRISISNITLSETDGYLTEVLGTVNGVNYQRNTLTYTNGDLTGINTKRYDTDGITVIEEFDETLIYTNGVLSSITKAWV